jgi:hypothetical protein
MDKCHLSIRKVPLILKETLSAKQTIHLTMVTTFGIKFGKYSGIVQRQVHAIGGAKFFLCFCAIKKRFFFGKT